MKQKVEVVEPYIDIEYCRTSCSDCMQYPRVFAAKENKEAYIKESYFMDPSGKYADLVKAAEKCPCSIIRPGTPLDPDEEDLKKWVKRAERFNQSILKPSERPASGKA